MTETERVDLEQFRMTCDAVKQMEINVADSLSNSPNRLVGYSDYTDVFRSMIPIVHFDRSGDISGWDDFSEIFPDTLPYGRSTTAAVLFTGQTGCGRHTADKTMMSVALDTVRKAAEAAEDDDDLFGMLDEPDYDKDIRYYLIDFNAFGGVPERLFMKDMDELFSQMMKTAAAEPSAVFYYSLGNVTDILNNKKLTARFLYNVGRIKMNPRSRCILTCIYDGKAETLTENIKQPFFVLEFDLPTKRARQEYFRYLTDRYMNIKIDLSADELTELTEGFTFAMIKKLAAHMMMTVKAEIVAKKLNPDNYVRQATINELEVLIIDAKKIKRLVKLIKITQYTEPSPPAAAYPAAYPVAYAPQAAVPAEPAQAAPQQAMPEMNDEDLDKSVEASIENIDTPDQFFEVRENMLRPTGYSPVILMERGKMYPQAFRDENIPLRHFLIRCREEGFASLDNIHTAFAEANKNGGLGFRPLNSSLLLKDRTEIAEDDGRILFGEVIMEGKAIAANLSELGHDVNWLKAQLVEQGCSSTAEVFLGICEAKDKLVLFKNE